MLVVRRAIPSVPSHLAVALAVLCAVGAVSYGATQILPRNSVGTVQLRSNAVTAPKIKNGAIVAAKLAPNAVTGKAIVNSTITADDLALNAVTTSELAAGAVGIAQLADGSITTSKLAPAAVGTLQIADRSIRTADIGLGQVTGAELADTTITAADLVDGAVTNAKITSAGAAAGRVLTADGAGRTSWITPVASGAAAAQRTFVPHQGSDSASGTALLSAVQDATDARREFVLEPGTYDLGTSTLTLGANQSMIGAGRELTVVSSANSAGGNGTTLALSPGTTVLRELEIATTATQSARAIRVPDSTLLAMRSASVRTETMSLAGGSTLTAIEMGLLTKLDAHDLHILAVASGSGVSTTYGVRGSASAQVQLSDSNVVAGVDGTPASTATGIGDASAATGVDIRDSLIDASSYGSPIGYGLRNVSGGVDSSIVLGQDTALQPSGGLYVDYSSIRGRINTPALSNTSIRFGILDNVPVITGSGSISCIYTVRATIATALNASCA